jgi:hypothetical protein
MEKGCPGWSFPGKNENILYRGRLSRQGLFWRQTPKFSQQWRSWKKEKVPIDNLAESRKSQDALRVSAVVAFHSLATSWKDVVIFVFYG